MEKLQSTIELLRKGDFSAAPYEVKVYKKSYSVIDNVSLVMVKSDDKKWLLATGEGPLFEELQGEIIGDGKACPLTHENRLVLNRYFPYTVPQSFSKKVPTIGLGDRLGVATPGHIEVVRDRKAKPILAQQSIRELTLTGRSMNDVLDASAFAVFQEGYKDGYGADGDHLKEESDIKKALSVGMSMITLDCSDHIQNHITRATADEIRREFHQLPEEVKSHYKKTYLNKTFDISGVSISFSEEDLMKKVLIYRQAIDYMVHVYNTYISKAEREIDFEISIDETETVTSPGEHFLVANELSLQGVNVTSLAPRFCGEFQKGIDYIGDKDQFERELKEHALIADHFNYKLSIHSGSDKFSVFPIIAKHTNGIFHIKTAGTNWLEAVRVISRVNPALYREMHSYALEHFEEARKHYHITPDIDAIKTLSDVSDNELELYLNDDNTRQLLHVTFGILLSAKDSSGKYLFRDKILDTLNKHEEDYREALVQHIAKHLDLLNV